MFMQIQYVFPNKEEKMFNYCVKYRCVFPAHNAVGHPIYPTLQEQP